MKGKFTKTVKVASMFVVLSIIAMIVVGCDISDGDQKANEQRENAAEIRTDTFDRAEVMYPVPQVTNFLARKMLVKYVERQDVPSHLFYIYVLADTGNYIGYYVAQAAPVNVNAFLSSTESIYSDNSGNIAITTLPSIDGIFYGGAGSSQGGDNWFFFDAESDALIILYGMKIFVADQPLALDVQQIKVGNP